MTGRVIASGLGLAAASMLSACGGGGSSAVYPANAAAQTEASEQLCVACATGTVPRFAYSLNYYGATLAIYNVDAASGQLRARGYVKTGTSPVSAVSDVAQRFMFVLNQGAAQTPSNLPPIAPTPSTVSVYTRDNVTGDLKESVGSPYAIANTPTATHLAVHPSGRFLYVVNAFGVDSIYGWSIDRSTGRLTPIEGEPWRTGTNPAELVFDADGRFAYLVNRDSNNIFVYDVDPTTGALTRQSTMPVAAGPASFTIAPSGEFAYVVSGSDSASGSLHVFSIDAASGALNTLRGSPYALGAYPAAAPVLFHPNGRFAYVRNVGVLGSAGSISAFAVDQLTGTLVALPGSFPTGSNSGSASIDASGRFLYVVNRGDPNFAGLNSAGSITAFSIDSASGALEPTMGIGTLKPAPYNGSIDPSGKFFYTPSAESDQIYAFNIDQTNGALSPLAQGAVMRTGAQPQSLVAYVSATVATAPVFKSKLAYVPNAASNSISAFAIDAATGSLGVLGTAAAGGDAPQAVAVPQGSRFLYSAHFQGNASTYAINGASGALQQVDGGEAMAGLGPTAIAVDPSHRFAYVVNSGDRTVSAYKIDAASGTLVPYGRPIATVAQPLAAVVDPTGRNLFVSSLMQIQVFAINTATGGLTLPLFGGSGVKTLLNAGTTQIAIDPRGKFLYTANPGGTGSIEIYPIDPYSGALGLGNALVTNRQNGGLAIDPTGRFLYTADFGSNTITSYAIGQTKGQLVLGPSVSAVSAEFVTVDYSGKYLYSVLANNSVVSYSINPMTGALAAIPGGGAPTQTNPGPLVTVGEVE
jgi:6-phosphogluconolactonase